MSELLPLWKPIKIIYGKPIIFNVFCHYLDPEYKSYRPFIIFYDDKDDYYYYLKARDARNNDGNLKLGTDKIDPKNENFFGEVLIKGTGIKDSLLEKDSLIDCSQIFKISRRLLENIVDRNSIVFQNTKSLPKEEMDNILDGITACLFQVPPIFQS